MGNLKKTINSGSNRVVRMTISKMHGTAVNCFLSYQKVLNSHYVSYVIICSYIDYQEFN